MTKVRKNMDEKSRNMEKNLKNMNGKNLKIWIKIWKKWLNMDEILK